jgi:hypothetical protein
MNLDTDHHLIDELDSAERVPAEEQIRRARRLLADPDVPVWYPPGVVPLRPTGREPLGQGKPTPGLDRGTPSLRGSRGACRWLQLMPPNGCAGLSGGRRLPHLAAGAG